jgi:hypothetical protein
MPWAAGVGFHVTSDNGAGSIVPGGTQPSCSPRFSGLPEEDGEDRSTVI